jgi:hypothetical protein
LQLLLWRLLCGYGLSNHSRTEGQLIHLHSDIDGSCRNHSQGRWSHRKVRIDGHRFHGTNAKHGHAVVEATIDSIHHLSTLLLLEVLHNAWVKEENAVQTATETGHDLNPACLGRSNLAAGLKVNRTNTSHIKHAVSSKQYDKFHAP